MPRVSIYCRECGKWLDDLDVDNSDTSIDVECRSCMDDMYDEGYDAGHYDGEKEATRFINP